MQIVPATAAAEREDSMRDAATKNGAGNNSVTEDVLADIHCVCCALFSVDRGTGEWTGDWSDNSPLWTRRMLSKLNHVPRDDGAFWISFSDFCVNFEEVYIARFFDTNKWISRGKVFGEWSG